ncbi:MAG: hypothetical protein OHK0029_05420 [Armatimonadaceae bacterium]
MAPRIRSTFRYISAVLSISTGLSLLAGCGGGGSSSGSNGGSTRQQSPITATVRWAARSRATNIPSSALSAQIILQGAGPNGNDFIWTFNRDPNRPEAYTETLTSPVPATVGQWQLRFTLHTQPNGGGDTVGATSRSVDLSQSTDIGDIAIQSAIKSVEILPGQKVGIGQTLRPQFTARNANGTPVAVSPESATIALVSGQDVVSTSGGNLQGTKSGVARITISLDGVTSPAQEVAVGEAALALNVNGATGYVPVGVVPPGSPSFFANVASFAPYALAADWFASAQYVAPANYGDRQFAKWQFNGQDIGTSPSLSFQASKFGAGNLTAVYQARTASSGGFTPNFYRSTYKRWATFPVKVYFATDTGMTSGMQQTIRNAIDFWIAASGDRISYQVVNNPQQANITFRFDVTPTGVRGFCDSQWDANDLLTSAAITLSNELKQAGQGQALTIAARHEFGHALGLTGEEPGAGHSDDAQDTMFPTGNAQVGIITARDINTLTTLYQPELTRSSRALQPGKPVGSARILCE